MLYHVVMFSVLLSARLEVFGIRCKQVLLIHDKSCFGCYCLYVACCAVLCCVVLCFVVSCRVVLFCVVSCCAVLCRAVSCRVRPHNYIEIKLNLLCYKHSGNALHKKECSCFLSSGEKLTLLRNHFCDSKISD
jgi:hypothetical protein